MYIQITINGHSKAKQQVRQYTHSRIPYRNLQPDSCRPVLPLATTNLDFTPTPSLFYTRILYPVINLLMSYRLELKLFAILKLVANPAVHL
jgi:hypothetical protein